MQNDQEKTLASIAIKQAGGPSTVSSEFDILPWAVSKWGISGVVPPKRIPRLCEMGGYQTTPHQLDSVVYPYPQDALPPQVRDRVKEAA